MGIMFSKSKKIRSIQYKSSIVNKSISEDPYNPFSIKELLEIKFVKATEPLLKFIYPEIFFEIPKFDKRYIEILNTYESDDENNGKKCILILRSISNLDGVRANIYDISKDKHLKLVYIGSIDWDILTDIKLESARKQNMKNYTRYITL